jgi:hypothetical protein
VAKSKSKYAVCWCLTGALTKVSKRYSDYRPAADALHQAIKEPLVSWNDAPGRTQAEVLAKFDEAIAALEAQP